MESKPRMRGPVRARRERRETLHLLLLRGRQHRRFNQGRRKGIDYEAVRRKAVESFPMNESEINSAGDTELAGYLFHARFLDKS